VSRASRRRWFWAGVVGALGITAAGAGVAVAGVLIAGRVDTPVREYFDALAHGRAADALALGGLPDGDRAFLTAEVLDRQLAAGRIQDVRVGSTTRSKSSAQVGVQYQLVGTTTTTTVHDTVHVIKDGLRWRLADTAVPISVSATKASTRMSFADVVLPENPILLFPGAMPLQTNSSLLEVDRAQSVVSFTGNYGFDVVVNVPDAGRLAIGTALDAAIAACLAEPAKDPTCPLKVSGVRFVPASMSGAVAVQPSAGAFTTRVLAESDGRIAVSGTFQIQATWRQLDFNNITQQKSGLLTLSFAATVPADVPVQILWGSA
jgi:hypothetical protein